MASELILPPGVERGETGDMVGPVGPGRVVVDNRTDLPDDLVEAGVRDYFVENASLAWGHQGTFATYANGGSGSMLARTKFTPPSNVHEEIALARDLADRDDDVKATIFAMLATAFGEGMENFHEDERTTQLFNRAAREMQLDAAFKEIYREYLIASQVTTVAVFTRSRVSFTPRGTGDTIEERLALPLLATLPAEHIRVTGSDLFGNGDLAYLPPHEPLRKWLEEFFGDATTAARRAAMAREDPLAAALFTSRVKLDERRSFFTGTGEWAYTLNPRMAQRFTMPKGSERYPRPLLTANFALIEAKRLLNVMDYALLQGGANFIVVAKKGDDKRPATPDELTNLGQVVAKAGRTGVIVGDHRLNFDIITPNLTELLNADKRNLVGRKIANGLLRVPELPDNADAEGVKMWVEILSRVISSDRRDIKRHVEATIYDETANRNRRIFTDGAPKLWFPKIILQGGQFFNDYVLKLRDRGDIPRKFAVEAGGFDWEAGVAVRKQERADNIDQIMAPAAVPFSSPNAGPQDNNNGRPVGSSPNNGAPGAQQGLPGRDSFAPRQQITRNAGETVRAYWDSELASTVRVGEVTYRLLEQYPDRNEGRITAFERRALESGEQASEGPVTVVPVNPGHATHDERMVRLAPGLGVVIGYRDGDDAVLAKAFSFRQPEFDELAAQELLIRLGYDVSKHRDEVEETEVERDESGNLIKVRRRIVRVDA